MSLVFQIFNEIDASSCVCDHTQMKSFILTLKVRVATIDAQWEGIGDVGSARYEPALLPP